MKSLSINVTKYEHDLYVEKFKTPISERNQIRNKWRDIPVHEQEDSVLLRCQSYSNCPADSTKQQSKSQ